MLHFKWKWESEFKSDIPDMPIDCIHLTIISHLTTIFLMQEVFPKEKGN